MKQKNGLLIVVSGPAGSGKGTVLSDLIKDENYKYSVSATTRAPRPDEVDGVNYHFLTREGFEARIARGEMLELTEYCGNYYGTPKAPVDQALDEGKNIILEIEVQGALQVKEKMPEAIMIFIMPPNYETLLSRIRGRGTETEEVIQTRMKQSHFEIDNFPKYDYVVVNDDLEKATAQVGNILDLHKNKE